MRHRKMKFKAEYLDLLKKGRKKTTIRMEKKYELGETVYIADTNGKIHGKAVIEDIIEKNVGSLTDRDAVIDGFEDLDSLKKALKDIYGDVDDEQKLYIYHLKILRWKDQPRSSSQRK